MGLRREGTTASNHRELPLGFGVTNGPGSLRFGASLSARSPGDRGSSLGYQPSLRSAQVGFFARMSASFLTRVQPLICIALPDGDAVVPSRRKTNAYVRHGLRVAALPRKNRGSKAAT